MSGLPRAAVPVTHVVVREADAVRYDLPMSVEVGHRVIGVVASANWAIEGVYDVVTSDRRRDGVSLTVGDPVVPHCGVAIAAVEQRARRTFPRHFATPAVERAAAYIAAIEAETISPTPWHRVDHRCAGERLTLHDAAVARTWGCNTCGRDPSTEYAPRFEAHRTDIELDPRIDLGITIAVCPSCHEILHQPLAPTVDELMYGLRPACPECGARHADIVSVADTSVPAPVGVIAFSGTHDPAPDFVCGSCGHEW
ncbi:hypothetical protein [Williamsia deligens]|uniref:Uncharacterized protein n=1 Tax=Williamsia deligens TaxID=321325 RepID=A0ABW3G8J7_9NOCA|nr:hypothetical protein [Williamsia deligens]MCP2192749.1 hypothetical protein [Williamsia deligens]